MSHFDLNTLRQLSQLACLECTDVQLEATKVDLEKILTLFEQLQELETKAVPPFHSSREGTLIELRDDLPSDPFGVQSLLGNAPKRLGNMICTPLIQSRDL